MRTAGTRFAGLLSMTLLTAAPAGAQTTPVQAPHATLSPLLQFADFSDEVNLARTTFISAGLGVRAHRFLGAELSVGRGETETVRGGRHWLRGRRGSVTQRLWNYGFGLFVYPLGDRELSPYVMGGWRETRFASNRIWPENSYESGPEFGLGALYRVAPRVFVRGDARQLLWSFDSPPAPNPPGEDRLTNWVYSVGVQIALGGRTTLKDADGDGVGDKRDRCPDTPRGARVDMAGCPLDDDKDGVFDGLDQCDATPLGARVDLTGCPLDGDKDGVFDGLDQCADTPQGAKIDPTGCPTDADLDGVYDGLDRCANTPTGAQVDRDGCPTDADQDGIWDGLDQCPNTPSNARVDAKGCPIEVSEKEVELLDTGKITVRNINFETGKWDLLPESTPVLDEIGAILLNWPELKIEIGGHTDARGSDKFNFELSDHRANAVRDYLVTRFPSIRAEQYTAKGYGEASPLASNQTIEGMAKNRRVEFKVLNTDVLKKERERRRLLER